MLIECPLCNDRHIDGNRRTQTACRLCDGGSRRFVKKTDISEGDVRGWLITTDCGAVWLASRIDIGGGYRLIMTVKLPMACMKTDEGVKRVFEELKNRCAQELSEYILQAERQAAGQAVH